MEKDTATHNGGIPGFQYFDTNTYNPGNEYLLITPDSCGVFKRQKSMLFVPVLMSACKSNHQALS